MAVTASLVKELREMTGAGMMDCKKALVETDGDIDKAVEVLREKGLSKAAKKAGRVAAEGLVRLAFADDHKTAAVIEVNSETDFVAKNPEFVEFVENLAAKALEENMDQIQQELSALYPDAYLKLKRYNIMYKKYPIELIFTGPDPKVLHEISDSVRSIMEQTPQITLITTDWEPSIPVLEVDYNQSEARRAGLSRQDLAVSILTATGGIPVGTFYDGIDKNTIYIKCTGEIPVFSLIS